MPETVAPVREHSFEQRVKRNKVDSNPLTRILLPIRTPADNPRPYYAVATTSPRIELEP
jgi:hypothetical protein